MQRRTALIILIVLLLLVGAYILCAFVAAPNENALQVTHTEIKSSYTVGETIFAAAMLKNKTPLTYKMEYGMSITEILIHKVGEEVAVLLPATVTVLWAFGEKTNTATYVPAESGDYVAKFMTHFSIGNKTYLYHDSVYFTVL
jgi:hypothetical protein